MDLSDPYAIFSGLFLGLLGTAIFIYGKKATSFKAMMGGVALCALPYFIASMALLWGLSVAVLVGLYLTREA